MLRIPPAAIKGYWFTLFFFVFVFVLPAAQAQPMGAQGEQFSYRVQPEDTLIDLAQQFTLNADNWKTLQELNQIDDPYRLPIGKVLYIPFSLIPSEPSQAKFSHLQGQVYLNEQPATKEDTIRSGDIVRTQTNSFATILLDDQSNISLPEQSELHFQRLQRFAGLPINDVIFELRQGGLETTADPNHQGVGRFEVRTPASITGVRGTRLRVSLDQDISRTELLQGRAHIEAEQLAPHFLQAQQGALLDPAGQLTVATLLDAPVIVESTANQGGHKVRLEPLAQADHYAVLITSDAQGQHIIGQQRIKAPEFTLYPQQAGEHYAFIRAVDTNGFAGLDTQLSFAGRPVLVTRFGTPVRTEFVPVVFTGP